MESEAFEQVSVMGRLLSMEIVISMLMAVLVLWLVNHGVSRFLNE